jgi:hypothetical protein
VTFDRTGMKADMSGLVADWGVRCSVKRRTHPTTGSDGHVSSVISTLVSGEVLWIQPVGTRGTFAKGIGGVDTETSHMVFQRSAGTLLRGDDRILLSGSSEEYDVLHPHVKESFNVYEARFVKKS